MLQTALSHDRKSTVAAEVAAAATHLSKHLRGRLRNVEIAIHHGGVVISGTTNSYYVKQLAQHAVMKRVSVPIASNDIEVQA